jgi:glycosyltransferase involved in cell wall biosynthesis
MNAEPIALMHVIVGLDIGGAEMVLYRLLTQLDRARFAAHVVSLRDIGPVGRCLMADGWPVYALGMRSGGVAALPSALVRLVGLMRTLRPRVVQTWMYHADLLGGLAAKLAGGIPVAWNLRQSNLAPQFNKRSTLLLIRACALLSHGLPARIVCGSEAARRAHARLGYARTKMCVIPNGFDLALFKPDAEARVAVRQELGLAADTPLIGVMARFDPQKNHRTFVAAAGLLHAHCPTVHFLLCGGGVTWENRALAAWIDGAGLRARCHLLGEREDMPRLTAALDVATLSSRGEGFPNALGEAMACGVPCVATAVGDVPQIVGPTGVVVPPGDAAALAAGWRAMLALGLAGRQRLGQAARRRIAERYSLPAVAAADERLYCALARRAVP